MNNIFNLSTVGGIVLLAVSAALIVNPLFWCVAAGGAFYVPETLSEIE